MKKLLNLTNSGLRLSDINFSSFSASKNWIGFFEIESRGWLSGVSLAIKLFDNFFREYGDEVFIVSALMCDDKAYKKYKAISQVKPLYDKFKDLGILQEQNEYFSLARDKEYPLPAMCIRMDILKWDDIKELAKFLMCYDYSINEWCFIIFPSLNLAVYPHDSKGFGCIGLNDEIKYGINFLKFCEKNSKAKVTIDKKEVNLNKAVFLLPKNNEELFSRVQEVREIKRGTLYADLNLIKFIALSGSIKDLKISQLKQLLREGLIYLDTGIFFIKNLKRERIATTENILINSSIYQGLSDFEWSINQVEIKNPNLKEDDFIKECLLFLKLVKEKIENMDIENSRFALCLDFYNIDELSADFELYTLRDNEKIVDFSEAKFNQSSVYVIV